MSTPDKPDNAQASVESPREDRTVVTAAQVGQPDPALPSEPEPKPTPPSPPKPSSTPTPAPTPGPTVSLPVAGTVPPPAGGAVPEGHEVTSSAPPPWQRVASDTQYVTEQGGQLGTPANGVPENGTPPADATTRFADWGYQRSPRSAAYTPADKTADALAGPYPSVVSGTAATSVFAAAAGQSGVRPEARPNAEAGRTTVNFAAPPPMAPPPPPHAVPPPAVPRRAGRGPRRASLQVKRVDPWSVLKLAFVLSVALFFVWMVAVGVLYGVLDGMGVWDRLNGTYSEFAQGNGGNGGPLITASRVFGIAAIIGAINIVLFTALATVGSFVYNVSADLAGGLEITLAERE